jgi:hypothetical protein
MKTISCIQSNSHFLELNSKFDNEYNSRSFSANFTLAEIWEYFVKKNPDKHIWTAKSLREYTSNIIDCKVAITFNNRNIVSTTDKDITSDMIGKFNAVYQMHRDISNNIKFTDPISISVLDPTTMPMHPGGTRLMFAEVYTDTLPVIITTYNKMNRYVKMLPTSHIRNLRFNFDDVEFQFIDSTIGHKDASATYVKSLTDYNTKNKKAKVQNFKQVGDYSSSLTSHTYHQPKDANPPVTFELKTGITDCLYANGTLILTRPDRGLWRFVL